MEPLRNRQSAEKILELIHPEPMKGSVFPAGVITSFDNNRTGPHGEDDAISNVEHERWHGCLGHHGVDGSKDWLKANLNCDIDVLHNKKNRGRQLNIEQVSLNQFHGVNAGSRGKAEQRIGVNGILPDFDNVPQERLPQFNEDLKNCGLPISFAFSSGDKGVHTPILFQDTHLGIVEVDLYARAIYEVLARDLPQYEIDPMPLSGDAKYTCSVRLPGVMRAKTNREQILLTDWQGRVKSSAIDSWLDSKLPDWRTRKTWKLDGDLKSGKSKSTSQRLGNRASAYRKMVQFAHDSGWRYMQGYFWRWNGATHFQQIDWNLEGPENALWSVYACEVGSRVKASEFKDLVQCVQREIGENPQHHPKLLNVKNGVLDLDTLQLGPSKIDYGFTYCIDIDFDPTLLRNPIESAAWNRILVRHVLDLKDRITLETFLGYALTDDRSKHQTLVLHGPADIGKGTICNFMLRLLGSELTTKESIGSVLEDPAHAFNIIGKRVSISTEANIKLKNLEAFKALISFEEVSVHQFHKARWKVAHGCKFIASSNKDGWIPNFREIEKRLRVIQFSNSVSGDEKDITLEDQLWNDRKLIFHRLLAAYLIVKQKADIPLNPSTQRYLIDANENVNKVAPWVNDHEIHPGKEWVPLHYLHRAFIEETNSTMDLHEFGKRFKEAGSFVQERDLAWISGARNRVRGYLINKPLKDYQQLSDCPYPHGKEQE